MRTELDEVLLGDRDHGGDRSAVFRDDGRSPTRGDVGDHAASVALQLTDAVEHGTSDVAR